MRESYPFILSYYFSLNTSMCLCAHIYVRPTMSFAAHCGIYSLQMKMIIPSVPGYSQTPVPGILLSFTTLSAPWPPYCIPKVLFSMVIWDRQGPFSFSFLENLHSSTHFAPEHPLSHVSFGESCSPSSSCCLSPSSVTSISFAVAVTSLCKDIIHYARSLMIQRSYVIHSPLSLL